MKLYFVRHGKAQQFAASDEARLLTEDGIKSMRNMAEMLRRCGVNPTRIYSSPRVRAQETATIIAEALSKPLEITEACNFHFNASAVFQLTNQLHPESEVIFVGHNPSMSETVEALTGASVDLNTGAVACVTRVYPPSTNGVILKWLLTPKIVDSFFANS